MKKYNHLGILTLMLVSSTCWAYGGGGGSSTKACAKPKFTEFMPAENAEVAPGSSFSFTASKNTYPESIAVTVKELPASIKVANENEGTFNVTGTLPEALKGTYARISISGEAQNKCKGTGGWLVKISEK